MSEADKFWDRTEVIPFHPCWEWIGHKQKNGYGKLMIQRNKCVYAHRFSYELYKGKIAPGLCLDHICKNRGCVNPDHLRIVTRGQNTLYNSDSPAAKNRIKTKCPQGHEYSKENTIARLVKKGRYLGRFCKTCHTMRSRAAYYGNKYP